MMTGCSMMQPKIIYIDRSPALNAFESSQHQYPTHIRNGVIVKNTNVWTMREGNSFTTVKPKNQLINRNSWNLPDEAINKYIKKKQKAKSQLLIGHTIAKPKKELAIAPTITPAIVEASKHEILVSGKFDPQEQEQLKLSISLPNESEHEFNFFNKKNELNDESRERLRHISPHSLLYSKVEIIIYTNDISQNSEKARALTIKDELLRAGFRKANTKISFTEDETKSDKATVKFSEKLNVTAVSSIEAKKLTKDGINWVRIIAGRDSTSWLSDALKVKRSLLSTGIEKSKVTILHRKQTGTETSALIYKNK